MYIATVPNRNSPPAILLRESYREGSKVRTRTLANLTHWRPERIEALRGALKGDYDGLVGDPMSGAIFGVVFALKQLADQIGLTRALGQTVWGRLTMLLVLARVAHQGSRLSAVRWSQQHAVAEILGVEGVDEDALYDALDWAAAQQTAVEQRLYQAHVQRCGAPPALVLYDVTSSYFEGEQNELAAFGYNRDGKRGKPQIVIGLLTAEDGDPLAVRVFEGNTADPSTVAEQIETLKTRFGVTEVVMVGDRGMIKAKGKAALTAEGWRYLTALTDAQVRTLLKQGILQPDLFDTDLQEVEQDGKRWILRRNEALRAREQQRRADKLAVLQSKIEARNAFVAQSARADAAKGLAQLQRWVKQHRLQTFVTLTLEDRTLGLVLDDAARQDSALLDGCYVLETDVPGSVMAAPTVDARYRDLQQVERNFRCLKTAGLEVRPIFLRNAERTRAHVFIAMLALKLTRELQQRLRAVFGTTDEAPQTVTLDDALTALGRITYLYYDLKDTRIARLPRLDELQTQIFKALGLTFPRTTAHAA